MVVGDNVHDLAMARAAGAGAAIGVLSGNGAAADLAPLADAVLDSVCDLPGWLGANTVSESSEVISSPARFARCTREAEAVEEGAARSLKASSRRRSAIAAAGLAIGITSGDRAPPTTVRWRDARSVADSGPTG